MFTKTLYLRGDCRFDALVIVFFTYMGAIQNELHIHVLHYTMIKHGSQSSSGVVVVMGLCDGFLYDFEFVSLCLLGLCL